MIKSKAWVVLSVLIGFAGLLLSESGGHTFDSWPNSYGKLPWRAGVLGVVIRASHPNPGEANPYAIDFDFDAGAATAPVHAVSAGSRTWFQDLYCSGFTYVQSVIGGTYIGYKHLDGAYGFDGQVLVQGQLIAYSGNTGFEDNYTPPLFIECSTGPHLHIQRDSSPNSGPLPLLPLSGYTSLTNGNSLMSDNAGIGDICDFYNCTNASAVFPDHHQVFADAFNRILDGVSGYNGPGVTWDPCGQPGNDGGACWWVHNWFDGATFTNGVTQDFTGPGGPGAIMRYCCWSPWAYWVHGAIWTAYFGQGGAPGWMGYPTSEEGWFYDWRRQSFEAGYICWKAGVGGMFAAAGSLIWTNEPPH